jgi:hypothetical protein
MIAGPQRRSAALVSNGRQVERMRGVWLFVPRFLERFFYGFLGAPGIDELASWPPFSGLNENNPGFSET